VSDPTSPQIQLGFPLAFQVAARFLHLPAALPALSLHPIAAAAWVGLFATSLNLLPGGQLDGGHILYSVSPRLHRAVTLLTVFSLVPLGKYRWMGWFLWAALLAMTSRHPAVVRNPRVQGRRRGIALCGVLILILSFTPAPFAHSSGKEAWPELRDNAKDAMRDFRKDARHILHQNR